MSVLRCSVTTLMNVGNVWLWPLGHIKCIREQAVVWPGAVSSGFVGSQRRAGLPIHFGKSCLQFNSSSGPVTREAGLLLLLPLHSLHDTGMTLGWCHWPNKVFKVSRLGETLVFLKFSKSQNVNFVYSNNLTHICLKLWSWCCHLN